MKKNPFRIEDTEPYQQSMVLAVALATVGAVCWGLVSMHLSGLMQVLPL